MEMDCRSSRSRNVLHTFSLALSSPLIYFNCTLYWPRSSSEEFEFNSVQIEIQIKIQMKWGKGNELTIPSSLPVTPKF